MNFIYLSWIRR